MNELIEFAAYLTGHDKETIEQMFADWSKKNLPALKLKERSDQITLLEKYSIFLQAEGYLDTDWNTEPPYAIDTFMDKLKRGLI
jgi:hypothetical protein